MTNAAAITIFSDFASPYSFLAESALGQLEPGIASVSYRATPSQGRRLVLEAAEWEDLASVAGEEGTVLRMPAATPATGKAHEAALFARGAGREADLRRAIFTGLWKNQADIGRIDVLCEIAGSIGLDAGELKIALDIDLHADEVSADARLAHRLGIAETPVTYIGTGPRATVVKGAYTSNQLRALLQKSSALTQAGDHG